MISILDTDIVVEDNFSNLFFDLFEITNAAIKYFSYELEDYIFRDREENISSVDWSLVPDELFNDILIDLINYHDYYPYKIEVSSENGIANYYIKNIK